MFFAPVLSIPDSYNLGTAMLLLAGVWFLITRPWRSLSHEDRVFSWLLCAIFLIALGLSLFHGNRTRALDLPSRYLLLIPVLWMLCRVPPRLDALWAGLALGGVSAAALAAWQIEYLGMPRAVGFTGVIQFGDLGIMMGVLCLAALVWYGMQGRRAWQAFMAIGLLGGVYTSIASGSRGGWLAVAPVAVIFCIAFLHRRNVKRVLAWLLALCVGIGVLSVSVPSIESRYDQAVSEVQQYQEDRDADTSLGARFEMWRALAKIIPEKPWLGWGVKDFHARMQALVDSGQARPVVLFLANTHNNYLELWVFQGLLGLAATLALFAYMLWCFGRRLRSPCMDLRVLAVAGTSLLVSFLVFGMSQVILGRNNTLLFFLISLAVFWGCLRHREAALPVVHAGSAR
ncbi:O-antigen ligase family protein [Candidimonas humi]|uniref:O-antigen ligase family protein n=1 Tax=Candidimonas humi TaxID=683355 RepID=A0ABV8NYU3_9BURK|nr:O-antigen ligase family protein [Candidimonas humi]